MAASPHFVSRPDGIPIRIAKPPRSRRVFTREEMGNGERTLPKQLLVYSALRHRDTATSFFSRPRPPASACHPPPPNSCRGLTRHPLLCGKVRAASSVALPSRPKLPFHLKHCSDHFQQQHESHRRYRGGKIFSDRGQSMCCYFCRSLLLGVQANGASCPQRIRRDVDCSTGVCTFQQFVLSLNDRRWSGGRKVLKLL